MTWFQRLLLVTIAATFVLVVIGGTVRATDSGLGCPDWPTCHGKLIPSADKHTIIEYSHRTAASVVGVLFLGVTFFTFKTERRNKLVFWLAFTAGVLLAVQIILGGDHREEGAAVGDRGGAPGDGDDLHGRVDRHGDDLADAGARATGVRAARPRRRSHRLALLTAGTAFVTLVLGSYISGTDASLACSGWPLCNGSLTPGGGSAEGLHFLHRLVAGLLGIMTAGADLPGVRGAAAAAGAGVARRLRRACCTSRRR